MQSSLGRVSKDVSIDKIKQESLGKLIVSCGDHVVRETPPHAHTLLVINQQRILFHFNVLLQPLLVSQEVGKSLISLSKFILQ